MSDHIPWHEFTAEPTDAAWCICGLPSLIHSDVFPPRDPYSTRVLPPGVGA